MTNKKIKLTSKLSLKEVALDSSQFDIPKKIQVDFSKARVSKKYKNKQPTDIISHYIKSFEYYPKTTTFCTIYTIVRYLFFP